MRRRVVGAALTVVGVLVLLFEPVAVVQHCVYSFDAGVCSEGTSSRWGLVTWPGRWDTLFLPMLVIGIALGLTGVVLLVKRSRCRRSPSTAR
jgi:hypothetical protein